jgi:hypothetical protein
VSKRTGRKEEHRINWARYSFLEVMVIEWKKKIFTKRNW